MINKDEFEKIVRLVNEAIQKIEFNELLPEVTAYDAKIDGTYGVGSICSLSVRRKAIVINYDALTEMYPYMDEESIGEMFISLIRRIGRQFLL